MKMNFKRVLFVGFVVAVLATAGCTDAELAQMSSYGEEATVTCYSGGEVVFETVSTGKVKAGESGAGLYFKDSKTGKYVRTYADCIVVSQ